MTYKIEWFIESKLETEFFRFRKAFHVNEETKLLFNSYVYYDMIIAITGSLSNLYYIIYYDEIIVE